MKKFILFLIDPNYSYEGTKEVSAEALRLWDTLLGDEDYFEELREKYNLDDIIADAETDFERVQAITGWVTGLWAHDGVNEPENRDPLSILDDVTERGMQYRCVEYSIVIHGCLTALDIPARGLGLMTADVETRQYGAGHVVVEVFLEDLNKWVFVDGQWGVIPMLGDIPLNGVEFAAVLDEYFNAANNGDAFERDLRLINLDSPYDINTYYDWIYEYLYYFDYSYSILKDSNSITMSVYLTPIGAPEPTVFQIHYPIRADVYTDSAAEFYPAVTR